MGQEFDPQEVLSKALIAGMDEAGKDFKASDLLVTEDPIAARALQGSTGVLRPLLAESGVPGEGRHLISTVQGNLKDTGKNLIKITLEGAGIETVDLGREVDLELPMDAVHKHQPITVGMSALLTATMVNTKSTVEMLEQQGCGTQ